MESFFVMGTGEPPGEEEDTATGEADLPLEATLFDFLEFFKSLFTSLFFFVAS